MKIRKTNATSAKNKLYPNVGIDVVDKNSDNCQICNNFAYVHSIPTNVIKDNIITKRDIIYLYSFLKYYEYIYDPPIGYSAGQPYIVNGEETVNFMDFVDIRLLKISSKKAKIWLNSTEENIVNYTAYLVWTNNNQYIGKKGTIQPGLWIEITSNTIGIYIKHIILSVDKVYYDNLLGVIVADVTLSAELPDLKDSYGQDIAFHTGKLWRESTPCKWSEFVWSNCYIAKNLNFQLFVTDYIIDFTQLNQKPKNYKYLSQFNAMLITGQDETIPSEISFVYNVQNHNKFNFNKIISRIIYNLNKSIRALNGTNYLDWRIVRVGHPSIYQLSAPAGMFFCQYMPPESRLNWNQMHGKEMDKRDDGTHATFDYIKNFEHVIIAKPGGTYFNLYINCIDIVRSNKKQQVIILPSIQRGINAYRRFGKVNWINNNIAILTFFDHRTHQQIVPTIFETLGVYEKGYYEGGRIYLMVDNDNIFSNYLIENAPKIQIYPIVNYVRMLNRNIHDYVFLNESGKYYDFKIVSIDEGMLICDRIYDVDIESVSYNFFVGYPLPLTREIQAIKANNYTVNFSLLNSYEVLLDFTNLNINKFCLQII